MSRIPVRAGLARHRMELQEVTTTRDSMGGTVDSWCKARDVYCELFPNSGSESVTGDQITQLSTFRVRFRNLPGVKITASMRLVMKGRDCDSDRIFNILDVSNALDREPATELIVKEDLNAG